jgi:hypothetical protein
MKLFKIGVEPKECYLSLKVLNFESFGSMDYQLYVLEKIETYLTTRQVAR